jgi:polyhydroxybutyrate depolymerase
MKTKIWPLAILFIISLSLVNCHRDGNDALNPGANDRSMDVDGWTRTYRIYVPASYNGQTSFPLVIVLHGGGGTGIGMESLTGFSILAEQENFFVVYPDAAVGNHWADGRGTTPAEQQGVNDVRFIDALIDEISRKVVINTLRVYVCGFSNGSMMTNLLACELSTRFAAVGGVSGQLAEKKRDLFPATTVGIIYCHGTADPAVPYQGGSIPGPIDERVISTNELISFWVGKNRTAVKPVITLLPDIDPNDGTRVIHYAFLHGEAGSEVHLYRIQGGGHSWPGSSGSDHVCHDINATTLIWEFFKTQQK